MKPGKERALLEAIERGTLGAGSVAGDEYLRNMQDARLFDDGTARWVEVCYCNVPLEEERPYWEEFFDLVKVQDAHARTNCRDENGTEPGPAANATARSGSKRGWPSRRRRSCRFSKNYHRGTRARKAAILVVSSAFVRS